ncbi:MAG TPA: hypothetical protein VJR27_02690 [Candidatus Saccharimonadales bacterium]|nr:hypothetical protein [Candidatus Saccharimonadales bacterium]
MTSKEHIRKGATGSEFPWTPNQVASAIRGASIGVENTAHILDIAIDRLREGGPKVFSPEFIEQIGKIVVAQEAQAAKLRQNCQELVELYGINAPTSPVENA